jgi:hypothetical protein
MFEFTLSCTGSGNYVCPPDAGPAWRETFAAGCGMEALEANLRLTPEERLLKHDKILNEWLEFEAFMEKINRGWNFIKSHHVHTRHP